MTDAELEMLRQAEIRTVASVPPNASFAMAAYKLVNVLPQLAVIFVLGLISWKLLSVPGHESHALATIAGPLVAYMLHRGRPSDS